MVQASRRCSCIKAFKGWILPSVRNETYGLRKKALGVRVGDCWVKRCRVRLQPVCGQEAINGEVLLQ